MKEDTSIQFDFETKTYERENDTFNFGNNINDFSSFWELNMDETLQKWSRPGGFHNDIIGDKLVDMNIFSINEDPMSFLFEIPNEKSTSLSKDIGKSAEEKSIEKEESHSWEETLSKKESGKRNIDEDLDIIFNQTPLSYVQYKDETEVFQGESLFL